MSLLEDAEVNSGALSVIPVFPSFRNILATTMDSPSNAAHGLIKSGAGFLSTVIINTTTAGVVTLYDNTAASGTKIATLKASIAEGFYQYQCKFSTGLWVDSTSNTNFTIIYR